MSIREVKRGLTTGQILVDGRRAKPGQPARGGETIEAPDFVPRAEAVVEPEPELAAGVRILFEDEQTLAIDKPSGMACAPLEPGERGTALGVAIAIDPAIAAAGPPLEGGLVHRLDGGTSGVLLFARTPERRETLRAAFSEHRIKKTYAAVVAPPRERLPPTIDAPIRPGTRPDHVRVGEGPEGLPARSRVRVEARAPDRWRVVVDTRHGRRHQVRAHLAWVGAPIFGDTIYGGPPAERLMLHGARLILPEGRTLEAPLPPGF